MANDGSLMSLLEAWVLTQVQTLDAFDADNSFHYGGVPSFDAVMKVLNDIRSRRNPCCLVMFDGCRPWDLNSEGDQDFLLDYTIWIGNQSMRQDGAEARLGATVGETVTPGTNLLCEQVCNLLSNDDPAQASTLWRAAATAARPARQLTLEKGFSVMQLTLEVRACQK